MAGILSAAVVAVVVVVFIGAIAASITAVVVVLCVADADAAAVDLVFGNCHNLLCGDEKSRGVFRWARKLNQA